MVLGDIRRPQLRHVACGAFIIFFFVLSYGNFPQTLRTSGSAGTPPNGDDPLLPLVNPRTGRPVKPQAVDDKIWELMTVNNRALNHANWWDWRENSTLRSLSHSEDLDDDGFWASLVVSGIKAERASISSVGMNGHQKQHCSEPLREHLYPPLLRQLRNGTWLGAFFRQTPVSPRQGFPPISEQFRTNLADTWRPPREIPRWSKTKQLRQYVRPTSAWRRPEFLPNVTFLQSDSCDYVVRFSRVLRRESDVKLSANRTADIWWDYPRRGEDAVLDAVMDSRQEGPDAFIVVVDGPERISPRMRLESVRHTTPADDTPTMARSAAEGGVAPSKQPEPTVVLNYAAYFTLTLAGSYVMNVTHVSDQWEYLVQHRHYANANPTSLVIPEGVGFTCAKPRPVCSINSIQAKLKHPTTLGTILGRGRFVSRQYTATDTAKSTWTQPHLLPKLAVFRSPTDEEPSYLAPLFDGRYRWVPYGAEHFSKGTAEGVDQGSGSLKDPSRRKKTDMLMSASARAQLGSPSGGKLLDSFLPPWQLPIFDLQRCLRNRTVAVFGESHSGHLAVHLQEAILGDPYYVVYDQSSERQFDYAMVMAPPQRSRPAHMLLESASCPLTRRRVWQHTTVQIRVEHGNFSAMKETSGVDYLIFMGGQFAQIRGMALGGYLARLSRALVDIRRRNPDAQIIVVGVSSVMPVSRSERYTVPNYYRIKHQDRRNMVSIPLWNAATRYLIESRWMQQRVGARYLDTDPVFLALLDAAYDGEHYSSLDPMRVATRMTWSAMCGWARRGV